MAQLDAFELAWLRCRKIGYIFQSFNLIPVMTALENITLPMIFAGLKLGMGMALILIVAAELSAAKAGVGWMIWRAYDMFDIEQMFVALIVLSVLGYLFSLLLDAVERRVVPWKQT
jgi:ABC-type proline/glycine betaine transport system permease subunit